MDRFQLLRGGYALATTEMVVRAAIGNIKRKAPRDVDLMLTYYDKIKDREHRDGTFADPGQDADRLYAYDSTGNPTIQQRER